MKEELLKIAKENKITSIVDKINKLKKEEYKTAVAFLGEFSSGKTSLINALLKKKFLPTFDKPTTAIVTEIKKGKETTFNILKSSNGTKTNRKIEISEIAEEVQKKDINRILKIEINDSDLLDDKTILIDTPGVSSINDSHSKITYGYLPNMDVVFMVVNINMGSISKSLQTFIQDCTEKIKRKLHFVLNFKDTKAPSQIEKLVSEFKSSIKEFIENAKVIVVSSKEALKANDSNDEKMYANSGVLQLETIIRKEIPKLHAEISEKRYLEFLDVCKEELIFFIQEKEKNINLDKSEFFKKIENLKKEKKELTKNEQEIVDGVDDLELAAKQAVTQLNKNYTLRFIEGLNNNSLDSVVLEYTNEFSSILELKLTQIENFNLPESLLNKLATSTVTKINNKVGTIFQIANKLPSIINGAVIALATGGNSLAANLGEYAIAQVAGKAMEMNDKHLKSNEDTAKLINEGKNSAVKMLKDEKKVIKNAPKISKTRKTVSSIFSVLSQLNVVGFVKDKLTEVSQKEKVYNALKENSNHIIKDIFNGVQTIIYQKINLEIKQPLKLKEEAIEVVKAELSNSVLQTEAIKEQANKDLELLYKLV